MFLGSASELTMDLSRFSNPITGASYSALLFVHGKYRLKGIANSSGGNDYDTCSHICFCIGAIELECPWLHIISDQESQILLHLRPQPLHGEDEIEVEAQDP